MKLDKLRKHLHKIMNFIKELGPLALGTRIKNLSELLMKDMARVYKEYGVDFEPRWFTLFQLILVKNKISVTEIAAELNQTHPAVVQVVNLLERKKLISTLKDHSDKRKRMVKLSPKGRALAQELVPLWEDVNKVSQEILEESAPDLLDKIENVERALKSESIYQRMTEHRLIRLQKEIDFTDFNESYLKDFQKLNEEWLRSYLEISSHDKQVLTDPVGEIIKQNGIIVMMKVPDQVLGTYALKEISDEDCELLKFCIRKELRGYGLGKKLLHHAIARAESMNYKSIVLFTHHALSEATQLYVKHGFKKISSHPGLEDLSGRCSMMMQLKINQ